MHNNIDFENNDHSQCTLLEVVRELRQRWWHSTRRYCCVGANLDRQPSLGMPLERYNQLLQNQCRIDICHCCKNHFLNIRVGILHHDHKRHPSNPVHNSTSLSNTHPDHHTTHLSYCVGKYPVYGSRHVLRTRHGSSIYHIDTHHCRCTFGWQKMGNLPYRNTTHQPNLDCSNISQSLFDRCHDHCNHLCTTLPWTKNNHHRPNQVDTRTYH